MGRFVTIQVFQLGTMSGYFTPTLANHVIMKLALTDPHIANVHKLTCNMKVG